IPFISILPCDGHQIPFLIPFISILLHDGDKIGFLVPFITDWHSRRASDPLSDSLYFNFAS
ncbi:hypothetical protein, partial [Falsibacillus albus]|uniref:hypothetical protein n=1 Tax=Falsibacillus albus TaxID=2478915 RepID=UPI001F420699